MSTMTRLEIVRALERLGQLAEARGTKVELLLVGRAVMVLLYDARESTRDVDVIVLAPREVGTVRELARVVASERGWPDDWLNDGAKGFLIGFSAGPLIFSAPGIDIRSPAPAQLLAMKLSAWRDDIDIADARRLLQDMSGNRNDVWQSVSRI